MSIVPIFSSGCNLSNSQEGIEGKSKHCLEEVLAVMICACVHQCEHVTFQHWLHNGHTSVKRFLLLMAARNSLRMRKELVGSGIAFNLWTYPIADT